RGATLISRFAGQANTPVTRCHSFRQHFIEQPRTCRRKVQYVFRIASATATTATAFLTIQAGRVDIHRLLQITPADTEPLRPEIVRRTPLSQQRQRSFQLYPVARYLTEHQIKAVTQMLRTTKLAARTGQRSAIEARSVESPASRPGQYRLNHCTVTAWRSFRPQKPTSNALQPAKTASSRATYSVLSPDFSIRTHKCSPVPVPSAPG